MEIVHGGFGAGASEKGWQQYLAGVLCYKNLGDAVQDYIIRQNIQIPPYPAPKTTIQEVATACTPPPPPDPRICRYASKERTERKQHLVDRVRSMHEQGDSLHTIVVELHLARNTVRRYLRLEGPVQPTPRTRRLSQLDPFYDYLTERWNDGCSNAHQLFVELQEKGYRGG